MCDCIRGGGGGGGVEGSGIKKNKIELLRISYTNFVMRGGTLYINLTELVTEKNLFMALCVNLC